MYAVQSPISSLLSDLLSSDNSNVTELKDFNHWRIDYRLRYSMQSDRQMDMPCKVLQAWVPGQLA